MFMLHDDGEAFEVIDTRMHRERSPGRHRDERDRSAPLDREYETTNKEERQQDDAYCSPARSQVAVVASAPRQRLGYLKEAQTTG